MFSRQLSEIDNKVKQLYNRLLGLQNADGGFKGYRVDDTGSGLWTTASIIHILAKHVPEVSIRDPSFEKARDYLTAHQNLDGGWPFRPRGKSISDITAWASLALSHFEDEAPVKRGVDFLLKSRINTEGDVEDGWGLTTFEVDRVYSTMMAAHCLATLARFRQSWFSEPTLSEIGGALTQARSWLIGIRNPDGGWGTTRNAKSTPAATSMALLSLFAHGEDPRVFESAYRFLQASRSTDLWEVECELVVTQEV